MLLSSQPLLSNLARLVPSVSPIPVLLVEGANVLLVVAGEAVYGADEEDFMPLLSMGLQV